MSKAKPCADFANKKSGSASNSWSIKLYDLELSVFLLELKEVLPACPGIISAVTYDMVGVGVFTSQGLHAFLYDRSSAGNVNDQYNFVSYKIFKPS